MQIVCIIMVQLIPLYPQNPVVSCLIQIQTCFTFSVPAYTGCPGKEAVKRSRSSSKEVSNKCIAVRKVATPLRELTCHMGSHSVTCHPAEVTFPPLPQPKLVLDLATPEGCKAELT